MVCRCCSWLVRPPFHWSTNRCAVTRNELGVVVGPVGVSTACWLVSARCQGPVPLVMATVLRPLSVEGSVTALHVQLAGDTITVTWLDDVAPQRVRIPRMPTGGPYEPCA